MMPQLRFKVEHCSLLCNEYTAPFISRKYLFLYSVTLFSRGTLKTLRSTIISHDCSFGLLHDIMRHPRVVPLPLHAKLGKTLSLSVQVLDIKGLQLDIGQSLFGRAGQTLWADTVFLWTVVLSHDPEVKVMECWMTGSRQSRESLLSDFIFLNQFSSHLPAVGHLNMAFR